MIENRKIFKMLIIMIVVMSFFEFLIGFIDMDNSCIHLNNQVIARIYYIIIIKQ